MRSVRSKTASTKGRPGRNDVCAYSAREFEVGISRDGARHRRASRAEGCRSISNNVRTDSHGGPCGGGGEGETSTSLVAVTDIRSNPPWTTNVATLFPNGSTDSNLVFGSGSMSKLCIV